MAKFVRGKSGNPSGKPIGSKDKRTELRALLAPHANALIAKAVDLALNGDSAALRLCLDRLVAPLKARDEPVRLRAGDTLAEQGRTILKAMAEGVITPHEAVPMMQAIGAQARIVEVDTLAQRLEVLEEAILRRR